MKSLTLLLAGALAFSAQAATLYKSPTCGCCGAYADYLKAQGIAHSVVASDAQLAQIRQQHPTGDKASCHTLLIAGYIVEGHVPAEAIRKLLRDKPAIRGIALPGMPVSSPGMGPAQPGSLSIVTLEKNGSSKPFLTL
jgi:hypothetical protein